MALEKKALKSKPITKVSFKIESPGSNEVSLVGDFNNWDSQATPMKKLKGGVFKATVDLSNESQYEFKYIVDGVYVNDENPDGFVHNAFSGEQNSLVTV
ncbi:MAG: isoamylase early set domain-containing protein [Flavobacteriales bacterium]|nr:isoamylase early set domain-containing protein [Flavobacteriales bacterium]